MRYTYYVVVLVAGMIGFMMMMDKVDGRAFTNIVNEKQCKDWWTNHRCPPGAQKKLKAKEEKCDFCDCDPETFEVVVKKEDFRKCTVICCEKPKNTCANKFFNVAGSKCIDGFEFDRDKANEECTGDVCKTVCCKKLPPPPPGSNDCEKYRSKGGRCKNGHEHDMSKGKGDKCGGPKPCIDECCKKTPPPPPPPPGYNCGMWFITGRCPAGWKKDLKRSALPCAFEGCPAICCYDPPPPPPSKNCKEFFKKGGTCILPFVVNPLKLLSSCSGSGCRIECCILIPPPPPPPPGDDTCGAFLDNVNAKCAPGWEKDQSTREEKCKGRSCVERCCRKLPPPPPGDKTCADFWKTVERGCPRKDGVDELKCVGQECFVKCCGDPPKNCRKFKETGGKCPAGKKLDESSLEKECKGGDCIATCCHQPKTCENFFATSRCTDGWKKDLDSSSTECRLESGHENSCDKKCCIKPPPPPPGSVKCKDYFKDPEGGCKAPTKALKNKDDVQCSTKDSISPDSCQKLCCHTTCESFWANSKCPEDNPIMKNENKDLPCESDKCAEACCKAPPPPPGTCAWWWEGNKCPPGFKKWVEHKIKPCKPCPGCKPCICPPEDGSSGGTTAMFLQMNEQSRVVRRCSRCRQRQHSHQRPSALSFLQIAHRVLSKEMESDEICEQVCCVKVGHTGSVVVPPRPNPPSGGGGGGGAGAPVDDGSESDTEPRFAQAHGYNDDTHHHNDEDDDRSHEHDAEDEDEN